MNQRIGLVQFPPKSTVPNVALMRVASYHKMLGDEVVLGATPLDQPDVVYISTLFTWQRRAVAEVAGHFRGNADVLVGGPGLLEPDSRIPQPQLPPEIDAMPNDYDLYGIDYGAGYSSRGCIHHCLFCPVPKIEGGIREASAIGSLLNPRSDRLLLLDNNFFASEWHAKVREIRDRDLKVCWPQGLDIRLMDDEQAWRLADLHRRGQLWSQRAITTGDVRRHKRGQIHFAWDNPITEMNRDVVERGIRMLFEAGFGPNDLIFYVLIGFRSTVEDELERLTTLHSYGIHPKVMVYRDYGERDLRDPVRMNIQHWNDGHTWRTVPNFRDYRRNLAS